MCLPMNLKTITATLAAATFALLPAVAANATPVTTIAWVHNFSGGGNGIFTSGDGSSSATDLLADTSAAHTAKVLTTDGSYLYFADNQSGQQWQLVRTDLDGSNRLLLAQLGSEPADIVVTGVSIYYSAATAGLFRASSLALSTPTEIIGDSHPAGLGSSLPGFGYGAFAFANGKVAMDCGAAGLLIADMNFSGASNGVMNTDADYLAIHTTDIVSKENTFYFGGTQLDGIKLTTDPTSSVSGWTGVDTAVPSPDTSRVYNMFVLGSDLFYTTGTGYVYKWQRMDPNSITVNFVYYGQESSENYGIAVFETEPTEDTPDTPAALANTGLDPMLTIAGLGLLGAGIYLRRLAK